VRAVNLSSRLEQKFGEHSSFITQEQAHGFGGFGQTATTVAEDKKVIEQHLRDAFPGGLAGVDLLLLQAGMLNKRVTLGFAVPPAAQEMMLSAVDKWLARCGCLATRRPSIMVSCNVGP
jgi:hypothetical protein